MMRLTSAGSMVQAAFALGLALIAAPIVRNVTSELNGTVGRGWPFSLERCSSPATPGCHDGAIRSAEGRTGTSPRHLEGVRHPLSMGKNGTVPLSRLATVH